MALLAACIEPPVWRLRMTVALDMILWAPVLSPDVTVISSCCQMGGRTVTRKPVGEWPGSRSMPCCRAKLHDDGAPHSSAILPLIARSVAIANHSTVTLNQTLSSSPHEEAGAGCDRCWPCGCQPSAPRSPAGHAASSSTPPRHLQERRAGGSGGSAAAWAARCLPLLWLAWARSSWRGRYLACWSCSATPGMTQHTGTSALSEWQPELGAMVEHPVSPPKAGSSTCACVLGHGGCV